MKLAILNSYDKLGGAAIATYRLHRGLRAAGVDSQMVVLGKAGDDPTVRGPVQQNILQRGMAYLLRNKDERLTRHYQATASHYFSPARTPDDLIARLSNLDSDLIHLFWVNSGFMRIETLPEIKKPMVWTLHDMWPFTGGCHYDDDCGRFRESCGNCPILKVGSESDLSRSVWKRKHRYWNGIPITVVATSRWLADMARSSSLFMDRRIEVIPNGLDTMRYKPLDKTAARIAYNLPLDKRLVLFSAFSATTNKRKGGQYLAQALEKMAQDQWDKKTELIVIGASQPENTVELGMKVHYMGHLQDEISQVLLYSAADVTVAPSTQENLSNTVMESLACGTPVVAFDIGGMPDMIDHRVNGYLAKPFKSGDLADGIRWVLEDRNRHEMLSISARETVKQRYAIENVSQRYLDLYRDILK